MKTLKHNGYSYSVIIKLGKTGNKRFEIIKKKIGFKADWTRVSIDEYRKIESLLKSSNKTV